MVGGYPCTYSSLVWTRVPSPSWPCTELSTSLACTGLSTQPALLLVLFPSLALLLCLYLSLTWLLSWLLAWPGYCPGYWSGLATCREASGIHAELKLIN